MAENNGSTANRMRRCGPERPELHHEETDVNVWAVGKIRHRAAPACIAVLFAGVRASSAISRRGNRLGRLPLPQG